MPDELDTGPEAAEAAAAPDVGEAIAQMNQRLDSLDQRIPEADEERPFADDGLELDYGGDHEGQLIEGLDDDFSEFDELVGERVHEAIGPYVAQQQQLRQEDQLRALADEFPRLRDPEVLDAVAGEAESIAEAYGNPAMAQDPRLVLRLYQAYEASLAAEAGAGEPPRGAELETGVGPGAPADEDPNAAYMQAVFGPSRQKDAFSS